MMERDFYLGRILTGRVTSGVIRVGDKVHGLQNTDEGVQKIEDGKVCWNLLHLFSLAPNPFFLIQYVLAVGFVESL